MIKPTIGRVVWFWPLYARIHQGFAFNVGDNPQPCAAIVSYVWRDDMVNLSVFDHDGVQHAIGSVPLIQENEPKPDGGFFCQWMPYQIGQAKRESPTLDLSVNPPVGAPVLP